MRNILTATLLATFALPAAAQVSWYAGAAGGAARTDDELVANRETTIQFARDIRSSFDDGDAAWKAFAGLRFNRVLALEIAYADLGRTRLDTRLQGGDPPFPAAFILDRKITGYGVDLVASPPLDWGRFAIFGKAGLWRTRLEAAASLEGNIEFSGGSGERTRTATRREDTFHWGVGAQFALTRTFAVRAEYERFTSIGKPFVIGGVGTTGQADTDVAWLGVVASF